MTVTSSQPGSVIQSAVVIHNVRLCREHYRLTFCVPTFPATRPGQFVHLCPERSEPTDAWSQSDGLQENSYARWMQETSGPMLRRAFSVAGLKREADGVHIDVIHRVVGRITHWMKSLDVDDRLSVLGPLGNPFPIHPDKPMAWMIAGGVGLPPMLWLSQALHGAGKRMVAFCGARSADLLPLTLDPLHPPTTDAARATLSCREFGRHQAAVVLSTDDGSLGLCGHIGQALTAYCKANPPQPETLVVYACGPEAMMRFVAGFCNARRVECYVCMERAMACGTGLCQSCVVPVHSEHDAEGWRYRLCCSDGPVFDARDVIWEAACST